MKIYLAGKIGKNDWRHSIVNGLRRGPSNENAHYDLPDSFYGYDHLASVFWPVMKGAIGEHDYTGPYFVGCDHGCFHESGTHGWGDTGYCCSELSEENWPRIINLCTKAIRASDFIFAWLDSLDSFGTYIEIGYAAGLGKPIYIAGRKRVNDLWFAYASAQHVSFNHADPRSAFDEALEHFLGSDELNKCESPIERQFYRAAEGKLTLVPQVTLGHYRVDFAIPDLKVAIELDGHNTHKTKEQRTRDARRERAIQRMGWHVIRFTGTEVYTSPEKCIDEVLQYLRHTDQG